MRRYIEAVSTNNGITAAAQTLPARSTETDEEAALLGEIDVSDVTAADQYEDRLLDIQDLPEADYNAYTTGYQSQSYNSALTHLSLPSGDDQQATVVALQAYYVTHTNDGTLSPGSGWCFASSYRSGRGWQYRGTTEFTCTHQ